MKLNNLLWGALIIVAVVFVLRIIGPLVRIAMSVVIFGVIAAFIYSLINPTFRARMLNIINQIFK